MMPLLVDRRLSIDAEIEAARRPNCWGWSASAEIRATTARTTCRVDSNSALPSRGRLAMEPGPRCWPTSPTGNLDTKSADAVFELMRQVNRDSGTSFLLVTHNMDLARRCDRIIEVVDGRISA